MLPSLGGRPVVDYTPMFISQILDTVGAHFDRHQTTHHDLMAVMKRIEKKVEAIMASAQELTDGVHQLFGTVDSVLTKLSELASGGGASPAQLQALLDEVNAERTRAADALTAVNPPPAPPV